MIKNPLIAHPRARSFSFLITIEFGALKFWKIFNKYQQDIGSNLVTLGVIAN
jgi:hypothetical protein